MPMNKKPVVKGKKPKLPPDYDVIIPGMGYTQPKKKTQPKKIVKKK
jgi:hypothetical protein